MSDHRSALFFAARPSARSVRPCFVVIAIFGALLGSGLTVVPSAAQPIVVTVDPSADRRPISPLIYGVNLGSSGEFSALPYPLRRWGGNAVTRYNWTKDATNRASDWFFINLPESSDSTNLPDGSTADLWLDQTLGAGAEAILTVPMIGWTARDRVKRWGFSVAKYGPQQETECSASGWPSWCEEDAGNGILLDGTPVADNDPHDTSIEAGPAFLQGWMGHLEGRFGPAEAGGVRYYALDNEPILWNHTHRDVHPEPVDLDELWQRTQEYAEAIKAADAGAQVLGPVVWGWCAYFYSAADGCQPGPDMAAHGGLPLLEWYLAQNRARELQTGTRPVDVLDLHYYPQAPGVALSDDESVAALRLRSLRSLYDSTYVDESWIGQPVRLIPRVKEWIAARCPGVRLALTEYNWGGDEGISSALAQAEALAIFGREGVDMATRWVAPPAGSKVMEAFRLYLDLDGAGRDLLRGESVQALSSDAVEVGAYAILREGGTDTAVLLFNRGTGSRLVQLAVASAADGVAELFRFDATQDLEPVSPVTVLAGRVDLEVPARSATLLLVPLSGAASTEGGGGCSEDGPSAPGDGAAPRLSAHPSPFTRSVIIECATDPRTASVFLDVIDAAGRRIRSLPEVRTVDGRAAATWDGRTEDGKEASAGFYFVRVRDGRHVAVARLLRLR